MENLDPAEGYELYAPHYRKDHAHLDSFDWAVSGAWWKEAFTALEARGKPTVLDVGCGDGRTLARHEKWLGDRGILQGFDVSATMVKLAAQKVKSATLERLDLTSKANRVTWVRLHGKADLVSAFFMLVHFKEERPFFDSLADFVAPGGILLMNSIPQKSPPVLSAGTKKFTIRAYHHQSENVREAGLDAGFHLVREQNLEEDHSLVSTVFWWSR